METEEERTFDFARTVALSDGVFAIALTLLVLSITVPTLSSGHHGELDRRLLHRGSEFGSYALSFVVIAGLWVRHHTFFRELRRVDGRITVLNLVYLGFVAFLPYPTRVLGLYGDQAIAVTLYAATAGTLGLLAGLSRTHALRAGLVSPAGRRQLGRREHPALVPTVFLASIPIAWASTTAALLSWLLLAIFPALRQRLGQRKPGAQ